MSMQNLKETDSHLFSSQKNNEREPVLLICSVGGSPEPVRNSIDSLKPEYIIFVASPDSRPKINPDIVLQLKWTAFESHIVTLIDYEDILTCVKDIRHGIAQGMKDMHLPDDILMMADFTGGTKVMSASLALVMMEQQRCFFSYVGGNKRSKDGLGIVESGHEKILYQANPWEVMALREVRYLAHSFNVGDFATALTTAQELVKRMESTDKNKVIHDGIQLRTAQDLAERVEGKKKFYGGVADLIESYVLWDGFDHKAAQTKLRQALGRLEPYAMNHEQLARQINCFQKSKEQLDAVQQEAHSLRASGNAQTLPPEFGRVYLADLLANARRRIRAQRYDDAVARLYSAIEKRAKISLLVRHGIDNSAISPKQLEALHLPEPLYTQLLQAQGEHGLIRIGLQKTFFLLDALQDPLGAAFRSHEKQLDKCLETRNLSLLAHGYNPVSKATCEELFSIALDFLDMREEDLPAFPDLEWKSMLL